MTPPGNEKPKRVLTWPLTTGLNLGWQYTPFQKATFQYQFRFDGYVPRSHHRRGIHRPVEHRHQRLWRRLGIPPRRL